MELNYSNINKLQEKIEYKFTNEKILFQILDFLNPKYDFINIGNKFIDAYTTKLIASKFGSVDEEEDDQYIINGYDLEDYFETERKDKILNRIFSSKFDELKLNNCVYNKNEVLKEFSMFELNEDSDLIPAIIGAIAIDSEWDLNQIFKVIGLLIEQEEFIYYLRLYDLNFELNKDKIVKKLENIVIHAKFDLPEYTMSKDVVEQDGKKMWECKCKLIHKNINKKQFEKIAYGLTKKEAKENVAYSMLCELFNNK